LQQFSHSIAGVVHNIVYR